MKIKQFLIFLFFVPILLACQEDEDKIIQTDLTIEASQLFDISTDWGESLYFAMLSWEDYQQINPRQLPGCPIISLDQALRQVTLEFRSDTTCIKSGKTIRTGSLLLDFPQNNQIGQSWIMEYQGYTFNQDSLKGNRRFTKKSLNTIEEHFENMVLTTNKAVNSTFSGNLTHTITRQKLELVGFSTMGNLSGVNPAGRDFHIEFTNPRQTLVACSKENEILPLSGRESWRISRGLNNTVNHQISYESTGNCQVNAKVTLSDNRNLILTP